MAIHGRRCRRGRGARINRRRVGLVRTLIVAIGVAAAPASALDLEVTSPTLGQFVSATTLTVSGRAIVGVADSIATLEVNGVSALPVAGDGSFSLDVALDPDAIAKALETRETGWRVATTTTVESWVDGAQVLTDDFAPVDQLLQSYRSTSH